LKTDIYHSTIFEIPKQVRDYKHVKPFLTIYDLIPIMYPSFFEVKPKRTHFLNAILESLQIEDWIICISESTKNDLCEYRRVDPFRIFVTPLAADRQVFYPCTSPQRKNIIFEKYSIPDAPFFLGLSTLEPRKNIAHTVKCFLALLAQEKIENVNLVLVGAKGWKYHEIFEAAGCLPELSDRIIFTGFVDDEDLATIYSNALAFIYMSLYEGFGLPPLEAMNCGIPVITSNTSSLPEVVGDAGIMLPPSDRDLLCQAMLKIYSQEGLRNELSVKSLDRCSLFSWNRTCEATIRAYKTAMNS
jgi:glycosyltransferase involved in cell wall biosynthesis